MPKVSVIIPAYNAIAYLKEAVESVLKQTFTDFEILIVDDGSSDGTVEWVSQIKDPRVRLISQQNQGSSGARNTGITAASGEYIALLDADDIWEPTKLEKQVRHLEENPSVGLVDTWTVLINQQGKSTGRVVVSHAEGDDVWKQLVQFKTVCACDSTPLIRRSCFETVGLFNRELPFLEDLDMWIRLAARYRFAVIKEVLVRYRQHPGSKSTNCQGTLEAFRTIVEKAFESVHSDFLPLRERGYGRIYLYLAWRAINNRDYEQAVQFNRQAIAHRPLFIFSWDFIRQTIALTLLKKFGHQTYDKAKTFIQALRRQRSTNNGQWGIGNS
ncbi:glycosyltransferase [Brasilonema sp. UFV-L1]|uniref:glycosyltransferase family 2 protein n=1 Tax=Brasilonema sp. UFV-L1 TaxID=2234130 RepID=UPI00145F3686|nr:glycosyltransferase [Brasilonema sp. UFV-L1]NMG08966.1 glycosyltransferase family 2 protein [Brasilonema sp. UFV-L1]